MTSGLCPKMITAEKCTDNTGDSSLIHAVVVKEVVDTSIDGSCPSSLKFLGVVILFQNEDSLFPQSGARF